MAEEEKILGVPIGRTASNAIVGFGNGFFFGYLPEIKSALISPFNGKSYDQNLSEIQERMRARELESHTTQYGEVAGGLIGIGKWPHLASQAVRGVSRLAGVVLDAAGLNLIGRGVAVAGEAATWPLRHKLATGVLAGVTFGAGAGLVALNEHWQSMTNEAPPAWLQKSARGAGLAWKQAVDKGPKAGEWIYDNAVTPTLEAIEGFIDTWQQVEEQKNNPSRAPSLAPAPATPAKPLFEFKPQQPQRKVGAAPSHQTVADARRNQSPLKGIDAALAATNNISPVQTASADTRRRNPITKPAAMSGLPLA